MWQHSGCGAVDQECNTVCWYCLRTVHFGRITLICRRAHDTAVWPMSPWHTSLSGSCCSHDALRATCAPVSAPCWFWLGLLGRQTSTIQLAVMHLAFPLCHITLGSCRSGLNYDAPCKCSAPLPLDAASLWHGRNVSSSADLRGGSDDVVIAS